MSEQSPVIELQDVEFSYAGRPVLQDITLSVRAGEFLGIVGPNGGGKTTLLKVMLGLLKPDKGVVRLFGRPAAAFRERFRIGYVPQKAVQFDPAFPATAYEVACMGRFARAGLFRWLTPADHARVREALSVTGMLAHRHERIGNLSGGQQQRVFIARALAGAPDVLILDEPTTGVDAAAQEKFYALLKALNRNMNLTLLLVSHDIGMVSDHVTQLVCINRTIHFHGRAEKFTKDDMDKAYGPGMHIVTHEHP
ncbi:MAG: metal ABC transporter ATP-binding protein [Candidatus Sumerlaeia bacterium]